MGRLSCEYMGGGDKSWNFFECGASKHSALLANGQRTKDMTSANLEGFTMNKLMRRFAAAALFAAVTGATPRVWAQADAAVAYQQGKTAFAEGKFEKATELFTQASQTDAQNPEVFLWLGKAQYQLGHLNEAVTAWNATIKLSPNEPYAAQMLNALRGDLGDTEGTLAVADKLIKDDLNDPAILTLNKLLNDKALTETQRARALTLKAAASVGSNLRDQAELIAQELLTRYAKVIDTDQVTLLLGRAKLGHSRHANEGIELLTKLVADHPNTEAGITAQYELIAFDLGYGADESKTAIDGITAARVDDLANWVAAHPDHFNSLKARLMLFKRDMVVADLAGTPKADATLNAYDKAAIAVADQLFKTSLPDSEKVSIAKQLVKHLDDRYAGNKAFAAATAGVELVLKSPLSVSSRSVALGGLVKFRVELALADISAQANANKLVAGPLPKSLADAVAAIDLYAKEYPKLPAYEWRLKLAEQLLAIGSQSAWPIKIVDLKPAHAWAVQIALPLVVMSGNPLAVEQAVKVVTAIVNEVSVVKPEAIAIALRVNGELLAALSPENASWLAVAQGQVALLEKTAISEFSENVRLGKLEANAQISKTQQQLIAALAQIVSRYAAQAPTAIEKLRGSLQPWMNAGYFPVAEDAYNQLVAAVPEAQQRDVKLGIVQLWIQKAISDEQHLAAAGMAEPRKLDGSLEKALQSLYAMQAGVENNDPFLARVRGEIDRIVGHYKQIQYFEVAVAAIGVKAVGANPQAEINAQYQLAVLGDENARREIAALLKQYNATDKLTLTDATKASIVAYEKFLTDHPTDPLAMRAAEGVFAIASSFEQFGAYDVAAGIDRDFAAFAEKNAVLAKAIPGNSSVAEKAAFAAVTVGDVKARAAMTKSTAKSAQENKGVAVPPLKISDEFAGAITAYKQFVKTAPNSPFVSQAVLRVNAIALDYARADAWDVADGIYAGLLADQWGTREPERIEFSRGLCQIGKVMPEHAKEMLSTLLGTRGNVDGGFVNGTFARLDVADKKLIEAKGKRSLEGWSEIKSFASASQPAVSAPVDQPMAPVNKPASGLPEGTVTAGTMQGGGGGFGGADGFRFRGGVAPSDERSKADGDALAAISVQEARRANQVAMLRDREVNFHAAASNGLMKQAVQNKQGLQVESIPVLSPEELARQQLALDGAYKIFQDILIKHTDTATAAQARGEITIEMNYWRGIDQWQRAAAMGEKFLADNPTDPQLPHLRLGIATDHLAYASKRLDARTTSQEMLAEVTKRFNAARAELAKVSTDFPEERALIEDAQWRIATSFLTQARTVDGFSATLARGQFVRAATELRRVAREYAQHPQIGNIPQMLWDISMELHTRNYHDEALSVWNVIAIDYPTHPLAQQAQVITAQTYQSVLGRPLRAAEVYLEINAAHGGNDAGMQNAVFAIGTDLKNQKRWIESLRVLENFVQSFPRHAQAGQALTMIGQIHQANDAWQDAITAYRRVINEFPASGQWVQDAKWSIAECTINLSQWKNGVAAYESYVASFPKDGKVVEANRRIGVLKDLANYQKLIDEKGPKAYDAQFQIATIVNVQLGNWRKAVDEFQKVATNWPKSHLAADALHSMGLLYLQNNEIDEARTALRAVASSYPDSPYACDSLFQVGKSYEDEANRLNTVTRAVTLELNKDVAQRRAYSISNSVRAENRERFNDKVQELRKSGKKEQAELQAAQNGGALTQYDDANFAIAADNAFREQEFQTAGQLADRQDKINAALRKAVAVYADAAKVPGGDKAGEALLHMAVIYNDRLGESTQAMTTWLEIVRQFSGTAVAEEASWQIAQHYEKGGQYAEAVEAYKSFLRNYRRSPKAPEAQFFIAENYEHLGQWISAMDQYTNYVQNFPEGTLIQKAKEQISFIKTYRL